MTSIQNIFDELCRIAPLELQMDFDNSGFLLGRGEQEVHRVLMALDITYSVILEAEELGAELIVSHHPLIFHPLKRLTDSSDGAKALMLAEKRISVISMHTNLDIASGGVNDVLLRLLGAEPEGTLDPEGCGRIGTLDDPIPIESFLSRCKERLQCNGLRYCSAGRPVQRLAVLGGSGGDELHYAVEKGCDTYVTADVKYHTFLEAAELGINLIDADHFCTENPVISDLAGRLRKIWPETDFMVSRVHGQTVRFY